MKEAAATEPFSGAVFTASWHTSQEPETSFPAHLLELSKLSGAKWALVEMTDSRAMKWVERWKQRGHTKLAA